MSWSWRTALSSRYFCQLHPCFPTLASTLWKKKKKKSQFCLLLERAVNYGYDSIGTVWKYLENNIMAWTNVAMIFQVFLPTVLKLSTIKNLFFNDVSAWYLWARPEPPLTTVLSKLAKIKYLSPQRVCSCWPLCLVMRCCLSAFWVFLISSTSH